MAQVSGFIETHKADTHNTLNLTYSDRHDDDLPALAAPAVTTGGTGSLAVWYGK
jgi:hypothetical protein